MSVDVWSSLSLSSSIQANMAHSDAPILHVLQHRQLSSGNYDTKYIMESLLRIRLSIVKLWWISCPRSNDIIFIFEQLLLELKQL